MVNNEKDTQFHLHQRTTNQEQNKDTISNLNNQKGRWCSTLSSTLKHLQPVSLLFHIQYSCLLMHPGDSRNGSGAWVPASQVEDQTESQVWNESRNATKQL